jgi:hypothetical protein
LEFTYLSTRSLDIKMSFETVNPRIRFGQQRRTFSHQSHSRVVKPFNLMAEDFPPLGTGENLFSFSNNQTTLPSLAKRNLFVNSSSFYPHRSVYTHSVVPNSNTQTFYPDVALIPTFAREGEISWSNAVKTCTYPRRPIFRQPVAYPQQPRKLFHVNVANKLPKFRTLPIRRQNVTNSKFFNNSVKQNLHTKRANNAQNYIQPLFSKNEILAQNNRKNLQKMASYFATTRSAPLWMPATNTIKINNKSSSNPTSKVLLQNNRFQLFENPDLPYIQPMEETAQTNFNRSKRFIKIVHQKKRQAKNNRAVNQQRDYRSDTLPENAFKATKQMCEVLKASHHLDQMRDGFIPRQIGKEELRLATFPQPFATNDTVEKRFAELANIWRNSLCQTLEEHYHSVRNENLCQLEAMERITESQWNAALSLATKWIRKKHNIGNECLKEGLDTLRMAREKNLQTLSAVDNIPTHLPEVTTAESTENIPLLLEEAIIMSSIDPDTNTEITEEGTLNLDLQLEIASNDLNQNEIMQQPSGDNVMLLPVGKKKYWKAPNEICSFKKLLITDEKFSTPLTSDFFHLILENGSIWNLYNVITNSQFNHDTALILIHVGYKYNSPNNLKFIKTIINKIKEKAPNAKVLFTNLIHLPNHKHINEFNNYCNEKFPDFFLNSNIENLDINCKEIYSSKLFQKWNSQIIHLN